MDVSEQPEGEADLTRDLTRSRRGSRTLHSESDSLMNTSLPSASVMDFLRERLRDKLRSLPFNDRPLDLLLPYLLKDDRDLDLPLSRLTLELSVSADLCLDLPESLETPLAFRKSRNEV